VVELSSDLTKVEGFFSPGNVAQLEGEDGDFGSGGVLLLPPQNGAISNLATAAGKDGTLYLLNADNLGKMKGQLAEYSVGGCWCGQSYFQDGKTSEVVTSGGGNVNVYRLQPGKKGNPSLVHEASSSAVPDGQDPRIFHVRLFKRREEKLGRDLGGQPPHRQRSGRRLSLCLQ
jgi:hypothetical protein